MSNSKLSENLLANTGPQCNMIKHTQSHVHAKIHFKEESYEAENFTSFLQVNNLSLLKYAPRKKVKLMCRKKIQNFKGKNKLQILIYSYLVSM